MRHVIILFYALFLIACVEHNEEKKLSKLTQENSQADMPIPIIEPDPKAHDEASEEASEEASKDAPTPDKKVILNSQNNLTPPTLVTQPKLACSQFTEESNCKNNLLGCDWDPSDKKCKESSVILAKSCFQALDEKTCDGLSSAGCRWQFFSALKKSSCVPAYIPNDPQLTFQWHLLNKDWGNQNGINAIDAWSITRGDPKVVIGVIDHGFPSRYPNFDTTCTNRSIIIKEINNPTGGDHGVWVSSVAAACSNTGFGMSGVDQLSSVVAASLPYDKTNGFQKPDYVQGFKWLHNSGPFASNTKPVADIINLSLGKLESIGESFGYMIDESIRRKIIVVSAAGNENANLVDYSAQPYPKVANIACKPGAISVGATDNQGIAGNFSNWGPFVDIMAPGVKIPVANLKNPKHIKNIDGTSFSSPVISGVAALMKSVFPEITPQIARHIMRRTARPMTCEQLCPKSRGPKSSICKADICPASNNNNLWRPLGLVDAYAAVKMAKEMAELGTPHEPIVQSNLYWVGIGTKDLKPAEANNAEFRLTNHGSANAHIRLAPNQDPDVSINIKNTTAPLAIAAKKSAEFEVKYATTVADQKSITVYLEVLDDAGNFIDTFAILLVVAK